jgi:flagellar basal-body rod protein FlgC
MNISSSVSSINANMGLANASAHNIANANTEGFERLKTDINENRTGGVRASYQEEPNESMYSNTDLAKEITNQIVAGYAVGANGAAIKTKDEMAGTLLDIYA